MATATAAPSAAAPAVERVTVLRSAAHGVSENVLRQLEEENLEMRKECDIAHIELASASHLVRTLDAETLELRKRIAELEPMEDKAQKVVEENVKLRATLQRQKTTIRKMMGEAYDSDEDDISMENLKEELLSLQEKLAEVTARKDDLLAENERLIAPGQDDNELATLRSKVEELEKELASGNEVLKETEEQIEEMSKTLPEVENKNLELHKELQLRLEAEENLKKKLQELGYDPENLDGIVGPGSCTTATPSDHQLPSPATDLSASSRSKAMSSPTEPQLQGSVVSKEVALPAIPDDDRSSISSGIGRLTDDDDDDGEVTPTQEAVATSKHLDTTPQNAPPGNAAAGLSAIAPPTTATGSGAAEQDLVPRPVVLEEAATQTYSSDFPRRDSAQSPRHSEGVLRLPAVPLLTGSSSSSSSSSVLSGLSVIGAPTPPPVHPQDPSSSSSGIVLLGSVPPLSTSSHQQEQQEFDKERQKFLRNERKYQKIIKDSLEHQGVLEDQLRELKDVTSKQMSSLRTELRQYQLQEQQKITSTVAGTTTATASSSSGTSRAQPMRSAACNSTQFAEILAGAGLTEPADCKNDPSSASSSASAQEVASNEQGRNKSCTERQSTTCSKEPPPSDVVSVEQADLRRRYEVLQRSQGMLLQSHAAELAKLLRSNDQLKNILLQTCKKYGVRKRELAELCALDKITTTGGTPALIVDQHQREQETLIEDKNASSSSTTLPGVADRAASTSRMLAAAEQAKASPKGKEMEIT
ncbi:unnamed protein product [Amoebophrya sp. A120]|nr:unnamed protein product [Amoebophrya sp. A120]|eukprot:GSA120T00005814001.1